MTDDEFMARFKKMPRDRRDALKSEMDDYEDDEDDEDDEGDEDDEDDGISKGGDYYDLESLSKSIDEMDLMLDEDDGPVEPPSVDLGDTTLAKSFGEATGDLLDTLGDQINDCMADLSKGLDGLQERQTANAKASVAVGVLAKAMASDLDEMRAEIAGTRDRMDDIYGTLQTLTKSLNAPMPLKGQGPGAKPRSRFSSERSGDPMRKSAPSKSEMMRALLPFLEGDDPKKSGDARRALTALDRGDTRLTKSLVPDLFN